MSGVRLRIINIGLRVHVHVSVYARVRVNAGVHTGLCSGAFAHLCASVHAPTIDAGVWRGGGSTRRDNGDLIKDDRHSLC